MSEQEKRIGAESHMPFLKHLEELRWCLSRALLGILVGAIACFTGADILFYFLTLPVETDLEGVELIGTAPAEAFIVKLKVAIAAGVFFSAPYSFLQIWRFVSPGLYKEEKNLAVPFVVCSTIFFLLGAAFCYLVVFPFAFQFFASEYQSIGVAPKLKIGEYLSFCVRLLLVFGVVFELPLLSFFLARLGLLTHTFLLNQGRYAILVVFIMAAILTPPDIATQVLLAGPLLLLYGICIAVAYFSANPRSTQSKSV
jgi:sec-independent protein translocase protein TatC